MDDEADRRLGSMGRRTSACTRGGGSVGNKGCVTRATRVMRVVIWLLQHVLPRGLVRIRSFGFLANSHRAERLALIRRLLALGQAASKPLPSVQPTEDRGHRCPHCGEPALRLMDQTGRPNLRDLIAATYRHLPLDST